MRLNPAGQIDDYRGTDRFGAADRNIARIKVTQQS